MQRIIDASAVLPERGSHLDNEMGASISLQCPSNVAVPPHRAGDSASASDDSSSEDSFKDGAADTADRRDAGSVNGSVRSMDLRPTQLHKSDSMYSTDESRFSGLSEEFEPLVSETSLMFATLPASLLSSVRCLLFVYLMGSQGGFPGVPQGVRGAPKYLRLSPLPNKVFCQFERFFQVIRAHN